MMYQIGMVCDVNVDGKAHELFQKAVGLFRYPYTLEYTVTPRLPHQCVVRFMLVKDHEVAYVSVVYTPHELGLTAVCEHVDSVIGHRVGSFLFLLQYRLAMEMHVRLFTLDNMTDDAVRAARGIYSMLMFQDGMEGEEILPAYLDHVERMVSPSGSTRPAAPSGPDMVGIPYVPDSRLMAQAWNITLRRLWDRVQTLWSRDNPWSPHVHMKPLFLSYHPMTLRRFLPSL